MLKAEASPESSVSSIHHNRQQRWIRTAAPPATRSIQRGALSGDSDSKPSRVRPAYSAGFAPSVDLAIAQLDGLTLGGGRMPVQVRQHIDSSANLRTVSTSPMEVRVENRLRLYQGAGANCDEELPNHRFHGAV